jgi:GAF domain-containing protein/HAMP domain-containing protein
MMESHVQMARNAFVISLIIAGATFVIALFALISAFRHGDWQHFGASIASFVLCLTSLLSAWLSRRGHQVGGIAILLVVLQISLLAIANLIEGMAVLLAVGGLGATVAIAGLTFGISDYSEDAQKPAVSVSGSLVNWALIGGVIGAGFISFADVYTPLSRMPAPSLMRASVPFLVGIVLLILMAFVIRQFKTYSLQTKLLIPFVLLSLMAVTGELVFYSVSTQSLLAPGEREELLNRAIFVAFVIAAVTTIAANWVARLLTAPIFHLTAVAETVAGGDLSVRVPEQVISLRDEIGVLASTFNTMTERLRRILSQLEGRVASRTRALEQRSRYLEASAEVGRVVTSILEPEQLIEDVVDLIRDRFGLYYVGLFLVDSRKQWAELRAGTGEAGRAMLARRHRLPVDESKSMVGWTIVNNEARVAQDIELDNVQRATPELPDTRAEAALPLRARGEVLGALTVQSREYGIFDQDVLRVLQIMADQVAAALDNAQLYAQSQSALEMSSRVYGELNRQAWEDILRFQPEIKVRSDRYGVSILSSGTRHSGGPDDGRTGVADNLGTSTSEASVASEASMTENETIQKESRPLLSVSIKGRGGVIGALETYKASPDAEWSPDEIAMLEEIAERVGQALDSARLYRDTQRSAIREQLTTEITARIREEVEVEAILQRAIEELGRALGAKRATVQLEVQE